MADKKDKKDKDEESAGRKDKKGSKLFMPLVILLSLAAVVFIQVTYIFLLVGMLPAIVAYIVDRRPGKVAFQAVASFNFAGMLHYLAELIFVHDNSPAAVQQMMSSGAVWFKIYGIAAMGWVAIFILPYLAKTVLTGVYSGNVMRLEMVQKKLEKKWGREIGEQ